MRTIVFTVEVEVNTELWDKYEAAKRADGVLEEMEALCKQKFDDIYDAIWEFNEER